MFILRVLKLLGNKDVVEKNKSAMYQHAVVEEMRAMKTEITRLNDTIDLTKDKSIKELQVKVSKLEVSVDDTEQHSLKANIRIQGI